MLLASSFSWKRVVGDSQVGSTAEAGALAPPLEAIDDEDAEFEIRADGHLGMWGGPLECEADLANAESAPSHAGDEPLALGASTEGTQQVSDVAMLEVDASWYPRHPTSPALPEATVQAQSREPPSSAVGSLWGAGLLQAPLAKVVQVRDAVRDKTRQTVSMVACCTAAQDVEAEEERTLVLTPCSPRTSDGLSVSHPPPALNPQDGVNVQTLSNPSATSVAPQHGVWDAPDEHAPDGRRCRLDLQPEEDAADEAFRKTQQWAQLVQSAWVAAAAVVGDGAGPSSTAGAVAEDAVHPACNGGADGGVEERDDDEMRTTLRAQMGNDKSAATMVSVDAPDPGASDSSGGGRVAFGARLREELRERAIKAVGVAMCCSSRQAHAGVDAPGSSMEEEQNSVATRWHAPGPEVDPEVMLQNEEARWASAITHQVYHNHVATARDPGSVLAPTNVATPAASSPMVPAPAFSPAAANRGPATGAAAPRGGRGRDGQSSVKEIIQKMKKARARQDDAHRKPTECGLDGPPPAARISDLVQQAEQDFERRYGPGTWGVPPPAVRATWLVSAEVEATTEARGEGARQDQDELVL